MGKSYSNRDFNSHDSTWSKGRSNIQGGYVLKIAKKLSLKIISTDLLTCKGCRSESTPTF